MKKIVLTKEDDPEMIDYFLSKFNKINQIMKKFNKPSDSNDDEDDDDVNKFGYLIKNAYFDSYFFNKLATPRRIEVYNMSINKKQEAIAKELNLKLTRGNTHETGLLNMYIPDGKEFFTFLKDYKKDINQILIDEDNVEIKTALPDIANIYPRHTRLEEDSVSSLGILANISIDIDSGLEEFLTIKGSFNLYLDFDTNSIKIDETPPEDHSYLHVVCSHNYITGCTGISKKTGVITFTVESLEDIDDIYRLTIQIDHGGKMLVENEYIVVDQ